jgi:hypothetical protein
LGLFKFFRGRNNIVQDKQEGAVTEEYVQEIQVPMDEDIFRLGYIKMEGVVIVNGQGQDMEDGNNPDSLDDFFCPFRFFKYRIIYKNPDIEKGYELGNIIDVNDHMKKLVYKTAGLSFEEKIKPIADQGDNREDQNMQKNRALERIGIILPEVIRVDQNKD